MGSRFFIVKIIINEHILWNPSHVKILFILRLYELELTVRRKLFPFKIPWRLLKPRGCHVATRPVHLVSVHFRSAHYQPTGPESSGLFKWIRHPYFYPLQGIHLKDWCTEHQTHHPYLSNPTYYLNLK